MEGLLLALAWLSVSHGSVLRRAGSAAVPVPTAPARPCRGRTLPAVIPQQRRAQKPSLGEERRGYVRTEQLGKPENQVSQPFCDLLSFWR